MSLPQEGPAECFWGPKVPGPNSNMREYCACMVCMCVCWGGVLSPHQQAILQDHVGVLHTISLDCDTINPETVMLKAQLLCTPVLKQISETEFWVKKKWVALLLCQAKGDTVG